MKYKVDHYFASCRQGAQVSWYVGWYTGWHDTWHPQSLAKTLVEQILDHLELARLCHPTQSQEDDCYQHDYAFIRLALYCLQDCGSAHASLEQILPLEKPTGGWRDQLDSCCKHFPYYDINVLPLEKVMRRIVQKCFHSDLLQFTLQ